MVPRRGAMRHRPPVGNPGSRDGPAVEDPADRAAASSAGRTERVETPPHAPPRAGEREVRDGGEPALVAAQREQEVRDAVARRQVGVGDAARSSSGRAGRRAARAARRPAPTSQTPRSPRSSTRPVRACRSRASWPTRSPSSPTDTRSAPAGAFERLGLTTFAPRCAYSSGITQACAKPASVTGSASGWTANSSAPAPMNGTTCAVVVAVHSAAVRFRRCSSTIGAPVDGRALGQPLARCLDGHGPGGGRA